MIGLRADYVSKPDPVRDLVPTSFVALCVFCASDKQKSPGSQLQYYFM